MRILMMNKSIELGEITPYHFGKKLILSLDERWNEYFNLKNISFKVIISNNKLILVGPKVSVQDTTKSPTVKEMNSDFD